MSKLIRSRNLNLAPLFLRDVEDLARLAKENTGTHAENLFTRAAVVFAVIALDHFIDLYLERITPETMKAKVRKQIKGFRRKRKVGLLVAAKWFVVSDYYTPNKFRLDVPPFSELKKLVKLRNNLVHIYEKQLRSRRQTGEPLLLREMTWKTAEEACRTAKNMIRAFYQMAGKPPPDWIDF